MSKNTLDQVQQEIIDRLRKDLQTQIQLSTRWSLELFLWGIALGLFIGSVALFLTLRDLGCFNTL